MKTKTFIKKFLKSLNGILELKMKISDWRPTLMNLINSSNSITKPARIHLVVLNFNVIFHPRKILQIGSTLPPPFSLSRLNTGWLNFHDHGQVYEWNNNNRT